MARTGGIIALLASTALPVAGEVREERLDNGLHVLIKRVEGLPLVSVWSWIHAGSANERPGITGAAHWCEHMNFKGTERYDREALKNLIEREGGTWNGYTWLDQTAYFETVPSSALRMVLDIELQRLAASLFLPKDVTAERSVILSELQMGENDPENLLDIESTAMSFKAHPYRWPTIGWQSDIEGMTRDDLYNFYRRCYAPRNSTLVVVGDCDVEETLRVIRETFGKLPPGEQLDGVRTVEPEQLGERRVKLERRGETPYLEILYHTPTIDSADFFPLLALNALLGGAESVNLSRVDWRGNAAKSSRLYRGLVDTKRAVKAGSLFLPTKYPCVLCVYATAAEGTDLARLEGEALGVIRGIGEKGIGEAEFQKVLNQLRARFVYDSESITEQAAMLGFFDTLGNWRFGETFLRGVDGITKDAVVAAARKYLVEKNRTVGWYVPQRSIGAPPSSGQSPSATRPPSYSKGTSAALQADRGSAGRTAGTSRIALNAVRKVLPNGLTLILRENHASPSLVMYVDIAAGSSYDPADRHGLANVTAAMLDRGSTQMSASLIAEALDSSGTELDISCGRDRAAVVARLMGGKLPLVMEVMAQIVRYPLFPQEELEKLRGQVITGLEEAAHDTQQVAEDRAYERLYPAGNPYRHKVEGDIAAVKAISRRDTIDFYREKYGPGAVTIVLSGDCSTAEAEQLAVKFFGDWRGRSEQGAPTVLPPPLPPGTVWEKAPIPDKTQADIAVACRGISRDNPDYYALQVMNTVLGRFGMGGRLGRAIREEKGMAYYAFSAFVPYRYAGPFLVRAGVNPKNIIPAVEEIRKALIAMAGKGVTAQELSESEAYLIKSVPRQLETNAAVAAALADIQFYRLGLDYFERYPELIGKVSLGDVSRVAREYLHPDNCIVVIAGPVE